MRRIPLVKAFTLIEMLVVVVIIAVLAVVALPRFLNIQTDGRIAQFEAAQSQFQSAITFAHSKWLVNGGGNSEMNDLPGFGEDQNGNPQLDINDEGYPLGVDKNSPMGAPYNIGQGHQGCVSIWDAIMNTDLTVTTDRDNFDGFDFVSRRQNLTFLTKEGNPVTAQALCYYIFTAEGHHRNPDRAEYVFWYNSRTGEITNSRPSDI
ncbi:prepilin-type N-terminal cleavage/methylation domain-containing protein [Vibrio sp. Isolate33]|uniref:prepilin-type N-terminal cleavage/methylation domain-containing protein n=1 Tax=Vibrio sp. Isolate33 TaxID=2908539 RepID=UPI001EFD1F0E|nr:prepilin-type N-terminal cleavage/methylation domain-containing protein [Vibrio sp. Isolate33]MCG9545770.1 prepilin-type N-terminal cleavage/methylation domain-containing protein [Vibrio sp. Isolate33]